MSWDLPDKKPFTRGFDRMVNSSMDKINQELERGLRKIDRCIAISNIYTEHLLNLRVELAKPQDDPEKIAVLTANLEKIEFAKSVLDNAEANDIPVLYPDKAFEKALSFPEVSGNPLARAIQEGELQEAAGCKSPEMKHHR